MTHKKSEGSYTILVSDSFDQLDEKHVYEQAFRRWLVQQIEERKMSISEAIRTFNFHPANGKGMIADWRKKYAPQMVLSLPPMTTEEKQKLAALQQQVKVLEKALEHAKMKAIALDTLIDVAEDKLKISIRKKPGAKQ
jgi:transposase-like protein